jgi:multimeric flavodoxin WrbA
MNIESLKEQTPQQKVLCIGGSPRKGGNTDCIMDAFTKPIQKSLSTETIKLRDYYYQPCIGCERCRKDKRCTGLYDAMQLIYPKIIESQGLVLVSPTHNYNVTAWMKSFIDRLYCFYDFGNDVPRSWSSRLSGQGRKAVIIAVCEQQDKKDMGFTLEAMRLPLEALGYDIVDELAIFKLFKRGAVKAENQVVEQVTKIAEKMANLVNS